jgi:hypothetical protein
VRRLCENVTQLLLAGDTDTLTPLLVHPEATSSIMFAHTSPSVSYANTNSCIFSIILAPRVHSPAAFHSEFPTHVRSEFLLCVIRVAVVISIVGTLYI